MTVSRRKFLKGSSCAAITGIGAASAALDLGIFTRMAAAQSTTNDFKALVMVFMNGGADSHNIVLRADPQAYQAYAQVRQNLAIPPARLSPLKFQDPTGAPIAINNAFGTFANLINNDLGAVVMNVGTTRFPVLGIQRDPVEASGLPEIANHEEQQFQWQTSSIASRDRGGVWGRALDIVRSFNSGSRFASAVSTSDRTMALVGNDIEPLVIKDDNLPNVNNIAVSPDVPPAQRPEALVGLMTGNVLERAYQEIFSGSFAATQAAQQVVSNANVDSLIEVENDDDRNFRRILKVIAAARSGALGGLRRMVFFVEAGGWDSHENQNDYFDDQGTRLSRAIGKLMMALSRINATNQVTVFTGSDFGRAGPTSSNGTDHAWGSHCFVFGGAVRAGVYGVAPILVRGAPMFTRDSMYMVPQFSCDQYFATLGLWFGVPPGELNSVYVNLPNFSTNNLGFMQV